ncbi:MAG: glycoside hydrolase family 32 protein, partial [Pirellulales bacterium]
NLPVKTGAPKRRMRVEFEGRIVREFEIELADQMSGQSPDFWVFLDVTAWRNQRLTVVVDRLPENSLALERLALEDELRTTQPLYREPLRPQFHFSSRRGWNNDPNGLVFADGEWHLFYQHNPYGWNWGNMHWGHAVSRDLVRWQELPIALYPRQFGDWAFSGSAVVDAHNTSGWGTPEAPPLVLAYTSTGRGECMAYSRDRGRTWQEYEGNPVVRHTGRDPRLLWHAPTKSWVMAVYTEQGSAKQIAFHVSPDLQHWQETSRIDGFYECPDLYPLPLDGNLDRQLWILTAADSNYLVGTFDGRKFIPTGERQRGNYGNCFYAAQTFSQAPGDRRVIIGWLQAPSPGMPFNQCFSVPCELTLRTSDAGPRLAWTPVPELTQLRSGPARTVSGTARPGQPLETGEIGEWLDIECTLQPGMARQITLEVRGVRLTYDVAAAQLRGLDRTAPVPLVGGAVTLRVLADRTTVELFADRGFVYLPLAVIPAAEQRGVRVLAEGDAASVQLQVHPLRSAW